MKKRILILLAGVALVCGAVITFTTTQPEDTDSTLVMEQKKLAALYNLVLATQSLSNSLTGGSGGGGVFYIAGAATTNANADASQFAANSTTNLVIKDGAVLTNAVLTTPNLGVATATKVNKWTLTAPTTAATLTAGADNVVITGPDTSQTLAGLTDTKTFQNKTVATTAAGGNNTIKTRRFLWLDVDRVSGTSATMATSDSTANGFNMVTFTGNVATTNTNFVEISGTMPPGFDSASDLKLEYLQFTTSGTQTGAVKFDIGMADVADSANAHPTSFSNWLQLSSGTLTSPAATDVFSITGTLTSWRSSLTALHRIKIRIDRNDTNTDAVTLLGIGISYVDTQ